MWRIFGGLFMGWGLGANDAANIFGTGVAARVITYRKAVLLIAIFVIIGSVAEGYKGMDQMTVVENVNINEAMMTAVAAALTITVLTVLGLPTSTSQAMMGAIIGMGIFKAWQYSAAMGVSFIARTQETVSFAKLGKALACWVFTPIGAALLCYILYKLTEKLIVSRIKSDRTLNLFIQWGLIGAGCYGAYALGANNVANTTGVYYNSGLFGTPDLTMGIDPVARIAALWGGIAIAVGALTFSKKVMQTVGSKITLIGPLAAFVAELAAAITVHGFAQLGVPVSTSQAIVGAVIGIGLVHGAQAISKKKVLEIVIGWVSTPLAAGIVCVVLLKLTEPFF